MGFAVAATKGLCSSVGCAYARPSCIADPTILTVCALHAIQDTTSHRSTPVHNDRVTAMSSLTKEFVPGASAVIECQIANAKG